MANPTVETPAIDRDLLFGILALRLEFIDRAVLMSAVQTWSARPTQSLGQILLERGHLTAERHQLLNDLVDQNVSLGGQEAGGATLGSTCAAPFDSSLDVRAALSLSRTTSVLEDVKANTAGPQDAKSLPADVRYRVLRPHAKGGLGEVFVAEDTELHREVALKEIRPQHANNLATRQRFIQEAEITGGLEHPGIVPIYGLGTHSDGRPFYAMRLIKGDNFRDAIDRFHAADQPSRSVSDRRLALRGLLRRFIDVCNAMAYAHSRGVLHRDLKPANVMLGAYGETLIVDWGLAKTLAGDQALAAGPKPSPPDSASEQQQTPSLATTRTRTPGSETQAGSAIGTPGYMSPEQARGELEEIGPASDVYGLGAMLYYLLTGRGPLRDIGLETALQCTQAGDFPAPHEVKRDIPRALSAICLKAMALEPVDRYSSPRELADDIEHWLGDEPVQAYREKWPQRLARWGRRHRAVVRSVVALLATVALASFVGLLAVNRERERTKAEKDRAQESLASEEKARRRTRQALDDMTSEVMEKWMARKDRLGPGEEEFLKKALASYEEFAQESGESEEVRRGVADASARVGRIHYGLGRSESAEAAFRRALELFQRLTVEFPQQPEFRRELAGSHHDLGVVLVETGRIEEARAAYEQALELRRQLTADFPDKLEYRKDLALNYNLLGNLLAGREERKNAEKMFREAIDIQQQLVTSDPENTKYQRDLALTYFNLGTSLRNLNRFAEAESAFRESLGRRRRLAEQLPGEPGPRKYLADTLNSLGSLLSATGRMNEAEESYREAVSIQKRLAGDFPAVAAYRDELSQTYQNLGIYLATTDRSKEAEEAFQAGVALEKQLVADHPAVTAYRENLADAHLNLAVFLYQTGRLREAETAYGDALMLKKQLAEQLPAIPTYRHGAAMVQFNLALVLERLGKRLEAEQSLRDSIAIETKLTADHPLVPTYRLTLAVCHNALGGLLLSSRKEEAEEMFRKALAIQRKLVADFPSVPQYRQELAGRLDSLGVFLRTAQRPEQAEAALQESLSIREELCESFKNVSHYRYELANTLIILAELARNRRELSEARVRLEQARHPLEVALKANPNSPGYRQTTRKHRTLMAQVQAGLGHHDLAARSAEEIAALGWDAGIDAYDAACAFALCAAVVHAEEEMAEKDRNERVAAYVDKAMKALANAVTHGYKDVQHMKKDKDLDSLRARPDFQKLVGELEASEKESEK
jgi:serine/threonine-protein kinase